MAGTSRCRIVALLLVGLVCAPAAAQDTSKKGRENADKAGPPPRRQPPDRTAVYKTASGTDLKLYIYTPEGHEPGDGRPAIVFFFGGGWRAGSPGQFQHQCRYLASRGMVAITADYRVLNRQGTKAFKCVADARSAVRWVRAHAEELGVAPDRLVASGGSAGGHLAASLGVIEDFRHDDDDRFRDISPEPNALVLFNPALALAPFDGRSPFDESRYERIKERFGVEPEKISPYHHVDGEEPPMIMFFGTEDFLLRSAEAFGQKMRSEGNRCEMKLYEGKGHGFFNWRRRDDYKMFTRTMREADGFLRSLNYLDGEPTVERYVRKHGE